MSLRYDRRRDLSQHWQALSTYAGGPFVKAARRWCTPALSSLGETNLRLAHDVGVEQWLTGPIDIAITCGKKQHRITIDENGTFHAHHHHFGDLDAEMMLLALAGDQVPACLTAWGVHSGHIHPFTTNPNIDQSLVRAWRWLSVARTWALPDAPEMKDADRQVLISVFTTPTDWKPWADTGHSPHLVRQFLLNGASVEQAAPWLAVDMIGTDAATAAAAGELPDIDFTAWADHGFDETDARRWYAKTRCTPNQAMILRDAGANPTQAQKARMVTSAEVLVEWAKAGIGVHETREWITSDVPLAKAVAYQRAGMPPRVYQQAGALIVGKNRPGRGPRTTAATITAAATIDPAVVQQWTAAGLPTDFLAGAIASGASPAALAAWGPFPAADRYEAHRHPFEHWWDVVTTMTRDRWHQWRETPVVRRWIEWGQAAAVLAVVEMETAGLPTDFFDRLPGGRTNHQTLTDHAAFMQDAVAAFSSTEAFLDAAAKGWLSDAVFQGMRRQGRGLVMSRIAALHATHPDLTPTGVLARL